MSLTINLDTGQRLDITCRKGDSFNLELTFTDDSGTAINLEEYLFKMDVRESDTASGTILNDTNFTYTVSGESSNTLTVAATGTTMEGVDGGMYVYDIQSDSDGDGDSGSGTIKTWLFGIFKVNEDITL